MGRFNIMRYRPAADSSPNTEAYIDGERQDPFKTVILHRPTKRSCPCGCGREPDGRGRVFRMGHDARYRGKLIRAHLSGTPVAIVGYADGQDTATTTVWSALELAANHGWEGYLEDAWEREHERIQAKLAAANEALLERAVGPQVGDRRLVKVGRWEYTGQVLAVYQDGEQYEIEYVTGKGDVKTKKVPAANVGDLA